MRTEQEILDLRNYLEGYYSSLYSNHDKNADYYNLRMSLGRMRKGTVKYLPPTARTIIDSAVDHLMAYGHKVTMFPWNNREETKKDIETFCDFARGVIRFAERNYVTNIRRAVKKNMFLYGIGILKAPMYVYREKPEDMDDETWEKQLEQTLPFAFKSCHPKTILFEPSEPVTAVIESFDRTILSIKQAFPWYESTMADSSVVKYWEYWDNEQRQFFVNNDPILTDSVDEVTGVPETQNLYGFIPYEIGNAGFGMDSYEGKPEEIFTGILLPILSALKAEARLKTALNHGLEKDIYGTLTLDKFPTEDDFKLADTMGDFNVIDQQKYNPRHLLPPVATNDAYRVLDVVRADQQAAVPSTLYGVAPKGMTSGYMMGLSVGEARIKFDGVKLAWENMISKTLDKILVMTKYVEEKIGVPGVFAGNAKIVTIDPKKIDPRVQHFVIELDNELPEEKMNRTRLGMELQDRRGLPLEVIQRDYYGYNPLEMRDSQLVEDILNLPEVKSLMAQRSLQVAGLSEVLQSLQESNPQQPKEAPGYSPQKMVVDQTQGELPTEELMQGVSNEQQTVGTI